MEEKKKAKVLAKYFLENNDSMQLFDFYIFTYLHFNTDINKRSKIWKYTNIFSKTSVCGVLKQSYIFWVLNRKEALPSHNMFSFGVPGFLG